MRPEFAAEFLPLFLELIRERERRRSRALPAARLYKREYGCAGQEMMDIGDIAVFVYEMGQCRYATNLRTASEIIMTTLSNLEIPNNCMHPANDNDGKAARYIPSLAAEEGLALINSFVQLPNSQIRRSFINLLLAVTPTAKVTSSNSSYRE